MLGFASLWALVIGFLLRWLPVPEDVFVICGLLGKTLSPIALVSIGTQLSFSRQAILEFLEPLSVGLVLKLMLFPAVFLLIYHAPLSRGDLWAKVTLIESTMPRWSWPRFWRISTNCGRHLLIS